MLSELPSCEFLVPIDIEGHKGQVFVLWPCDAERLRRFVAEKFQVDSGDRDSWNGKCLFNPDMDAKVGHPTAVIAIRNWNSGPDAIAVLAHECFHAVEWFLKQIGSEPPARDCKEWSWEDAAYLLENIMKRALPTMMERRGNVSQR